MPSDPLGAGLFTARCYCGTTHLHFANAPQTVAYCHCVDCRRWTGAPVAAFAAFDRDQMRAAPSFGRRHSHTPGVDRWNCPDCGSPLAAQFDYLPDQVYVPLGIIDQASSLPPEIHSHTAATLPWLHIQDELPRQSGTARAQLSDAKR